MSKEINIIWVGRRIPYKYLQHLIKWRNLNPGYQINLITNENSLSIQLEGVKTIFWRDCFNQDDPRQVFLMHETERALSEKGYATLSNIVRHVKIFNDGGYYFDTDIIPLEPLTAVDSNIHFLSQPKETYGEGYAKHRFVVSALYGSQHSLLFNAAIDIMYESYKEQSLQDALQHDPDNLDFLRSYYTASLMLSRAAKSLYANVNGYDDLIAECQARFGNPTAFRIEQDGSWGDGMVAVLKESENLAAITIQRFFRARAAAKKADVTTPSLALGDDRERNESAHGYAAEIR